MLSRPRTRTKAALGGVLLATGLLAPTTALAASTSPDGTYFIGPVDMLKARGMSTNFMGDMPDASVYYENGTYYAYSTSTNGSFVPVRTSTDGMKSWQTNRSYTPPTVAPNGMPVRKDPVFNDALLGPARWAQPNPGPGFVATGGSVCPKNSAGQYIFTVSCTHMVSPSVVKLPSGKYLMAYGAWAKSGSYVRMAVTTAIGDTPKGPFTDYSTAPLYVGPYGEGSIDPQLFKDPATGRIYLQWMNQGGTVAGTYDSKIWSQEISVATNGVASKVGTMTQLLSTQGAQKWEANSSGYGTVVEQPSMIRYNGRYYLFYSSQLWTKAIYRMGYATCSGPMGPCTRASTTYNPLFPSSQPWNQDGPGGGSAFLDAAGKLRIAYSAWSYGKPGYSATNAYVKSTPDRQRFGHIAALDQDGLGNLTVAQRSLALAPVSCVSPNLFPRNDNWVDMFACQYPVNGPKVGATTAGQPEWWRSAGVDRYATSAAISRRGAFPIGGEVIIASGQNFPDALAAGPYSAGRAPVLLVPATGTLPATIRAELARLRPTRTTIVGGTGAVSTTMADQVRAVTGSTVRVSGASRYEVAAALSTTPTGTTIYVANGQNYPDALAGGVAAAREKAPLLITAPTTLPTATADAIRRRVSSPGVAKVVILGGTGSVSSAVESQIRSLTPGASVTRIAGVDRYATAAAVNRYSFPSTGTKAVLANGAGFADALSAVPYAARYASELLLTAPSCMPAATRTEIDRQHPPLTTGAGGTGTISDRSFLHGTC